MKSVHDQLAPREGVECQQTLPSFDCSPTWAHNLQECNGQRRGHVTAAGITDERSNFGYKDVVEESVTIAHCAVSIREVKGQPDQV